MLLKNGVYGKGRYYDRNPTVVVVEYKAADVGIHARTVRDTLTIPIGRKGKLDMLMSGMIRSGVSPAEAEVLSDVELVDSDLNVTIIHQAIIFSKSLGAETDHEHDSNIHVNSGDTINITTTDPSAGGTVNYLTRVVIQLYDT